MSICGKCIHYEICDEYVSPCETFPETENGCPCYKSKDDFVEVKHGEWIEKDDGWGGVLYTCSVCDCDWTTIDGTPFENNMRYCPECGAKMD